MRKKLFCALMSLGMVLSSGVAYAAESEVPTDFAAGAEDEAESPAQKQDAESDEAAEAARVHFFDGLYEYDEETGGVILVGQNVSDDELTGADEELPKIDAPTNARWEKKTGNMLFHSSVNGTGEYKLAIYKEGTEEPIYTVSWTFHSFDENRQADLSSEALQEMNDGRYYFTVYAVGNKEYGDSDICKSDILEYVRPARQLPAPSDLKWDRTTILCSLPEGGVLEYEMQYKEEGSEEWKWAARGSYYRTAADKKEEKELTEYMNKKGTYRFRVKALSKNIFEAVDSEWSDWSPEISSEEFTDPVVAELRDLLDRKAGADEILEALEKKDTAELAVSVQTDPVIRSAMKEAEQRFSEEKGISVKTAVASDMADKISGTVSILGAAFNAGSDVRNMTLNLTKPTQEREVDRQQYKNVVQINMTLDGAADTQNLKVPVRITMPIPEGVEAEKLQILHYHNDGTYEIILPYISGKTASFTLTSFSTFVFANKAEEAPKPSEELPFTDVPAGWRYDNIKFVYEKGIMTGLDAVTFQPDEPLTRAQFASVIYRMAGEPEVSYKSIFKDVPAGKWFSDAVIWAYENNIVAGLGNGIFGTENNITREQMARMLMESARVQGYSTSDSADFAGFADADEVSRWAADYMRWAVGSGIISGSTKDGKYYMNPKGQATRAECAVMLTKFIQKYQ